MEATASMASTRRKIQRVKSTERQQPPKGVWDFLALPEMVTLLIAGLDGPGDIYRVCLVSKTFNLIFIPYLYESVCLDIETVSLLPALSKSSALSATRRLSLSSLDARNDKTASVFGDLGQRRSNLNIQRMLGCMPRLSSLKLEIGVIYSKTISKLKESCLELESLSLALEWPKTINNEPSAVKDICSARDILGFANLTTLSLKGIRFNISQWTETITGILLNSPSLQDLRLSLRGLAPDSWSEQREAEYYRGYLFLPTICKQYAERGGQPLAIRRLSLGPCVSIPPASLVARLTEEFGRYERPVRPHHLRDLRDTPDHSAPYMLQLLDPSKLEEVAIINAHDGFYTSTVVALGFVSATSTPLLRRLSLLQIDSLYVEWFSNHCEENLIKRIALVITMSAFLYASSNAVFAHRMWLGRIIFVQKRYFEHTHSLDEFSLDGKYWIEGAWIQSSIADEDKLKNWIKRAVGALSGLRSIAVEIDGMLPVKESGAAEKWARDVLGTIEADRLGIGALEYISVEAPKTATCRVQEGWKDVWKIIKTRAGLIELRLMCRKEIEKLEMFGGFLPFDGHRN